MSRVRDLLLWIVVLALLGGSLFLPVHTLTRGKEPWFSASLVVVLAAVTVAASVGLRLPMLVTAGLVALGALLLLAMRVVNGRLDRLESFAVAYLSVLMAMFLAYSMRLARP